MLNFRADIPFVNLLGFTLHRMENSESELHYTPKPEHLNSHGVTHGGATMTLLDVALSVAARSDVSDHGIVTIEMKSMFMAPAKGPLVAKARRMHRTRSMAFVEGWVYDANGVLCSMATGTFRYVPRDKLHGKDAPLATD
ncbi:hypothetical protein SDC9_104471 [bioreactor metagenome]|uniref:Thioesterase domain-containing protein n=1 Tax=bioreactor metagenome TaxID=1076179 RepID=A0A645AY13_9ZZZZ